MVESAFNPRGDYTLSVESPRKPVRPAPSASYNLKELRSGPTEKWIQPLKIAAIVVFVAIPVAGLLVPHRAGRVVWTIAVASLPFFIVLVGYHRWRLICPLAFFARISDRIKRPGRRVSAWFEGRYYYFTAAIFVFSLWLRLIATNGDGAAISVFFIALTLAAVIIGALYTGKTWCNYICPVSFIEKIYTEPNGLRETPNSQCTKCTACKKFCPDINEENGYWKEIELPAKRIAYFAFPGLVFGFYFYYYVQAGTWSYYFGGKWTDEPGVFRTAFQPGFDAHTAGFFFLPVMPRAAASLLTLLFCALASTLLFVAIEKPLGRWLRRRDKEADASRVRHVMFALAGFTAFLIFYTYAGAPTLWKLPWVFPHLFLIVMVLAATCFLVRRLRRTKKLFAEETLARNILKRWDYSDIEAPRELRDAFLIHTIKAKEKARGAANALTAYKGAVHEALADGLVSRREVDALQSLRDRLQIKQADHEKIMAELAEEEQALLQNPARHVSTEKNLQLATYAQALSEYLGTSSQNESDQQFIERLRRDFRISGEEHQAVVDNLLGGERELANRLAEEVRAIETASHTIMALEKGSSPARELLAALLRSRCERSADRMLGGLTADADEDSTIEIRRELVSFDSGQRQSALVRLRAFLSPYVSEQLQDAQKVSREKSFYSALADQLIECTRASDPYIRATALYVLGENSRATEPLLATLSADDHEIVRETAERWRPGVGDAPRELITLEKIFAMRTAAILAPLGIEELVVLAHAGVEHEYQAGEVICVQGEPGDEVLLIVAGDVEIRHRDESGEKTVGTEGVGGIVGEMAVLDPGPRAATVVAGSAGARVLRLNGAAFREAISEDPEIAYGIMRILAQRLRAVRLEHSLG